MDESPKKNAEPTVTAAEPDPKNPIGDDEFETATKLFDKTFDMLADHLPWGEQIEGPSLRGLAKLLDVPSDESLYHYTADAGLQGILEQNCLHASSAYFMNDSSELDYGCEMFAGVVSNWLKEHPNDLSIGAMVLKQLLAKFSDLADMRPVLATTYVVCFCEEANLLSQWRAYGQTGGYSIGFHRSSLQEFRTDAKNATISLKRVIYDVTQQRKFLSTLLLDGIPQLNDEQIKREFSAMKATGQAGYVRIVAYLLELFVLREIVRFKHPAFKDEREWRLISAPKPSFSSPKSPDSEAVKFKPSHGVLTPYLEFKPKDKLLPISSVRFGPTLDKKRVEHSLQLLFKKLGYSEVPIEGSDIPVRL